MHLRTFISEWAQPLNGIFLPLRKETMGTYSVYIKNEPCVQDNLDWKNASWNGEWKKGDSEADHVAHKLPAVVWNEVWNESVGDAVNVMRNADKHKWRDDDIHDRVARNENKKTMSVSSQPNMVLSNE